jgi:hypothetical protein
MTHPFDELLNIMDMKIDGRLLLSCLRCIVSGNKYILPGWSTL